MKEIIDDLRRCPAGLVCAGMAGLLILSFVSSVHLSWREALRVVLLLVLAGPAWRRLATGGRQGLAILSLFFVLTQFNPGLGEQGQTGGIPLANWFTVGVGLCLIVTVSNRRVVQVQLMARAMTVLDIALLSALLIAAGVLAVGALVSGVHDNLPWVLLLLLELALAWLLVRGRGDASEDRPEEIAVSVFAGTRVLLFVSLGLVVLRLGWGALAVDRGAAAMDANDLEGIESWYGRLQNVNRDLRVEPWRQKRLEDQAVISLRQDLFEQATVQVSELVARYDWDPQQQRLHRARIYCRAAQWDTCTTLTRQIYFRHAEFVEIHARALIGSGLGAELGLLLRSVPSLQGYRPTDLIDSDEWLALGLGLIWADRESEGLAALEQAAIRSPSEQEIVIARVTNLTRLGRYQDALEASRVDTTASGAGAVWEGYLAARVQGDNERALDVMESLPAISKASRLWSQEYASLLRMFGREDEALATLGVNWRRAEWTADAPNKQGSLWYAGQCWKWVELWPGQVEIEIDAAGELAGDVGPELILTLNGRELGREEIRDRETVSYSARIDTYGMHRVMVAFRNNSNVGSGDRNLHVMDSRIRYVDL